MNYLHKFRFNKQIVRCIAKEGVKKVSINRKLLIRHQMPTTKYNHHMTKFIIKTV